MAPPVSRAPVGGRSGGQRDGDQRRDVARRKRAQHDLPVTAARQRVTKW